MRRAALALLLVACARPTPTTGPRIVSLAPNLTETVYALGLGSQVVGVCAQCDMPEAVRAKPRVGDYAQPAIEKIVALKPTLVLAALPEQAATAADLEQLGLTVMGCRARTLADVFATVRGVGERLGVPARGDSLARGLEGELAALSRPSHPRRVFVEVSANPLITVGGGSFLNDVIAAAGGANVFGSQPAAYPMVSSEEVVRLDPEVILVLHAGTSPAQVRDRLGWDRIRAVRAGCIITGLDEDLLLRPGPRVVQGIRLLSRRLATP